MLEKIYSTLYCGWIKSWYELVSSNDTEEVYLTKRKLVIILKDQMLGKEIYDIISSLNGSYRVLINNMSFKIVDYVAVEGTINYFSVSVPEEFEWEDYEEMDKLQRIVLLISRMCDQDVFLDESKFKFEDFDSISKILSFLTIDSDKGTRKSTIGLLIKYCH